MKKLFFILTISFLQFAICQDYGIAEKINSDPNCDGNCQDGYGTYTYNDGKYMGFFQSGKKQGFGGYTWNTGISYSGDWNNDQISGYGILETENGDIIQGVFNNGQLNGYVSFIMQDKSMEYALYKDGIAIKVYEYFSNGTTTGCVAGECFNGYGHYIYTNGGEFTGFYKDGYMQQGLWVDPNGDSYTGQFGSNNMYDGFGVYNFKNESVYMGDYKNGRREGAGFFFNAEDKTYWTGYWLDDKMLK